jgi:hypothetical protein
MTVVANIAATAMASTRTSKWIALAGSVPSGFVAMNSLVAITASPTPQTPPTTEMSRLSARNCRTSRVRPEPSAARMAASRIRPIPRPSVSAPTFIAAISSRQITAAETARSVERTVRVLSSCSELRFTTNWLKLSG